MNLDQVVRPAYGELDLGTRRQLDSGNGARDDDGTDSTTATAYSLGQQLTTTYNHILAIVLLVWAFGWTGGKLLVRTSYSQAKEKVEEQKIARAETKAARDAESGRRDTAIRDAPSLGHPRQASHVTDRRGVDRPPFQGV